MRALIRLLNSDCSRPLRRRRHPSWSVTAEQLEDRLLLSAVFRTIDGTDNNVDNPTWGAADTALIRIDEADYLPNGSGEAIVTESAPSPFARANPRDISNVIASQSGDIVNDRNLSDWVWQWGQFLDHDIDLTETSPTNGTADIPIDDPTDPLGPNPIEFDRSDFDPQTGTGPNSPRQQVNQITSYIDASNVYGSDEIRAAALRTGVGGRLKTSTDDLLPFNTDGLPNAGGTDPTLFLAGDVRANEQIGLTATHTLFVREHNRLADLLAAHNPDLTDEEIYQKARAIVAAEMQIITYNEFLPALLGTYAPTAADFAYDPTVNSSIANEFSTAFYRFGHSMLSSDLLLVGKNSKVAETLALRDAFFNPGILTEDPATLDLLLRGLAAQHAQEVDNQLVDDVRNFLFGPPGAGGLDLATLNIQRGRDHGLPDYNTLREAYGLSRVTSFSPISSDPMVQAQLEALYGSVDNIDPWVGGLAEDHLPGASTGELVTAALVDQFTRLRDGDRFFYLADETLLSDPDIAAVIDLDEVTLARVIQDNTGIKKLQDNVFFLEPATKGHVAGHEPGRHALNTNQAAVSSSVVFGTEATLLGFDTQPLRNSIAVTATAMAASHAADASAVSSVMASLDAVVSTEMIDEVFAGWPFQDDELAERADVNALPQLDGWSFGPGWGPAITASLGKEKPM